MKMGILNIQRTSSICNWVATALLSGKQSLCINANLQLQNQLVTIWIQ